MFSVATLVRQLVRAFVFQIVCLLVLVESSNHSDIYHRPTGSDDNKDQKRTADKTKNAKKTEKSAFSPLLFPLAIAIPDSIVTGVDNGSAKTALSTNSQLSESDVVFKKHRSVISFRFE